MPAYRDRVDAGRALLPPLQRLANQPDLMVLALPRGGVPVAAVIAEALHAPLDVLVARKLGLPLQPEVAMGAIAAGICVLDDRLIAQCGVNETAINRVRQREQQELSRREAAYRPGKPPLDVTGQCVILVDDGLATGSTMEAALRALRLLEPAQIVVAVPVASREALARIQPLADEVICPLVPVHFRAVGCWYSEFDQTSDNEVMALLGNAAQRQRR